MSLTGTLTLTRAFLSPANNPSNFISFGTAGGQGGGGSRNDTVTQEGGFRNYANFVTRLILGTAKNRQIDVTLRAITASQVALVNSWVGQTVLFRDTYGRKIYGAYTNTAVTDIPLSGKAGSTLLSDVTISLFQVAYIEGV